MNFVFEMMVFVFEMMNFVFEMMVFELQRMNCAIKDDELCMYRTAGWSKACCWLRCSIEALRESRSRRSWCDVPSVSYRLSIDFD